MLRVVLECLRTARGTPARLPQLAYAGGICWVCVWGRGGGKGGRWGNGQPGGRSSFRRQEQRVAVVGLTTTIGDRLALHAESPAKKA